MSTLKTAGQMLAFAVSSSFLVACGNGGSKTAGAPIGPDNTSPPQPNPKVEHAAPVNISSQSAKVVAGSTLKALLMSDISSSAIDNAVNVTREQNSQLADIATGVVITMAPVACLYQGNFTLEASLVSTGENIQIDFAKDLEMSFATRFNQCDQGSAKFHGEISINFTAVLNELLAKNNFTIDTQVEINELTVQQAGYYPFVINGGLNYYVTSPDGVNVVTEVTASDMYYSADNSYQVIEYDTYKSVHLPTGEYEYTIYSRYVDQMIEGSLIEYQTLEPLRGVGFSVPASGKLRVYGGNDSMQINVLNTQSIELAIDYGNDGSVDEIQHSTWYDLAVSHLTAK